ncbi:uncharacterized protein LOC135484696 isoform X3 [Lineus longissimus]|uniref:uncharacterized protein LOC135484696 isoform X3 n=1 Tax=Lineus longissimus TaxID=88925 RepID=UPI00315C9DEC
MRTEMLSRVGLPFRYGDRQGDIQIQESGRVKRRYQVIPGMSHYYTSDDYYSPSKHVLPGSSGALYLPTSFGKNSYPSKYSVDTPTNRCVKSPSLGAKHSHCTSHRYEKPRSNLTGKFSSMSLSPAMGHRPNISTERLLEQNTSLVPLGTSRTQNLASRRQVDLNRSPGTPRRSTRNIKSESDSIGKHNKMTFDMNNEAPNFDLQPKSPTLRRSTKYKGETETHSTSPGVGRRRKKQVVTFNMFTDEMAPPENGVGYEDDDSGDEMKEGVSSSDASRWIGCGQISSPCVLTADRGYLIWNRPKGTLEVIFSYGERGEDFSCFMDPQFKGVKVLRDRQNGKYEEIIDGMENPKASRNRHHRHSACRNRPENNFEFNSKNGQVRFILEALEPNARSKIPVFKINYTLIL